MSEPSAESPHPSAARLVPQLPFPPYTFVPGRTPHPYSDPRGHSFGKPMTPIGPPDPASWRACLPYLYGIDLFHAGFYWEAHEVWERLWLACGRRGWVADLLKGLIQLAAAGVKIYEGRPVGVRTHAERAAELLRAVASEQQQPSASCIGLDLLALAHGAHHLAESTMSHTANLLSLLTLLPPLLAPLTSAESVSSEPQAQP